MTVKTRMARLSDAMRELGWDLTVCALPMNVLMLSGYWPIVGTGIVAVDREGRIRILAPRDEEELARKGWADDVSTFQPASLDDLARPSQAIVKPLRESIGGNPSRIGYEAGEASVPWSYVAVNIYGGSMAGLLKEAFPQASLEPADEVLAQLSAVKTNEEIENIRRACETAAEAFTEGAKQLQAGVREDRAALNFRRMLGCSAAERADGWVSCMSGVNSGHAYGAYARSTHKRIGPSDLVLTHCNSYRDGYWTDITRTYVPTEPDRRQEQMYSAIRAAHDAAVGAIGPGVAARDVDRAARETLAERGFGAEFKHTTGHGVGFGAIDANALPRIHPKSPDRLEEGMVFNVEPGIYFPDYGGMRHCDMVAVTAAGFDLLTPFQPVEATAHGA